MTPAPARDLLPVVPVALVAGGAMAAVVATSLGLMPLYGQPEPGTAGWQQVAPDLGPAVRETLLLALGATVVALVVGMGLALVLLAGAPLVRAAALAVLAVPHVVGATTVLLWLGDGGLGARWSGAGPGAWPEIVGGGWPVATVLALAWKESAFVALVVLAALAPGHRERMETAATLGAAARHRWLRVLLPTAVPALAATGLIVLVYSIGGYEVAWLLGRTTPEPLPVLSFRLFGSIELLDRPAAAAAALVASALALGLTLVAVAAGARIGRALGAPS
ncbi:ABC transporter permease subunit [uncultured Nocardioides sp.]|uniref:ABC transporter permease subunit n=1 Tax=uncultured Nocardioides sp. TaxID=198441 RepID=UPI0026209A86|nr:ABC transporter permease subunit [uncultured Nocardioides sp.]